MTRRKNPTAAVLAAAKKIVLAAPTTTVRLDLAAGQNVREGFEGVDLWPGGKHVVDLLKFPWPFADESADELHCSHFIEHIECRNVEDRDIVPGTPEATRKRLVGKDMFFAFFDEAFRVIRKDGSFTVICPVARSNRAFQDPTHRRFIVQETFFYLSKEFRASNKLDHYRVECNFSGNVNPSMAPEMALLHPEAATRRFNESWNVLYDWHAILKPIKP